jgi:putative transposase
MQVAYSAPNIIGVRSIAVQSWLKQWTSVSYQAASAGRVLAKVDPRGTSQTCVCGTAVAKTRAQPWHGYPACWLSAARDVVRA